METLINRYISADGHVVEPADLWTTRMDRRFRDRAPRVESRPDADYILVEGLPETPVGLEGVSMEDKIAGTLDSPKGRRRTETRPGAFDPQARLSDQEMDHVRAEVIYPGVGLALFSAPDPEYGRECFRVYNEWLAEFCTAAPGRLLGVGLLPMKGPVEWAVEEAKRAAKIGLRSVGIPTEVPGHPYRAAEYDRLWATLEELGLPVSLHVGTDEPFHVKFLRIGLAKAFIDAKICTAMRSLADIIWGAVPQRFPKLRFVLAECGIGWLPSALRSMDHWWEDHRRWMKPRVDESATFYFQRQFWATFEDDPAGILTRDLIGIDRLMWGSDYPHTEGTFPRSHEQIIRDFQGVPQNEVNQMVVGNAAALYGIS